MTDIGFGTVLQRETDTPGTYEDVGEVIELTPPGLTAETFDKTHMKSPGRVKEYGKGLLEPGEVSCVVQALPDALAFSKMIRDVSDTTTPQRNYRIAWGDGATEWDFAAIATGFEPGAPMEERITGTFSLKVSGLSDFVTEAVTAANA